MDVSLLAPLPDASVAPLDGDSLEAMPIEWLEHEIVSFASHVAAAMCAWLLLVAEFDRRRAYESWECLSTAQWLNVRVGVSLMTGRQHVAVAHQLVRLPAVLAAFRSGQLSYSRVRAVCRIATPADEVKWLEVALNATGSQLDRIVSDSLRVVRAGEPEQSVRQAERRCLSWSVDDDGMYEVRGVLPPEVGVLLAKLVNRHLDDDRRVPIEQRRVDGFAEVLADAASASAGAGDARAGDARAGDARATSSVSAGGAPGGAFDGASRVPVLIVVHRYEEGVSRIEGGPVIPEDVADRLACGADQIVATHTATGITYGRKRVPSKPMRRLLVERDGGCRFPGCGQKVRLHAHHVVFYSRDGKTSTKNLVMVCPRHHGAIHHRGWVVSGNPDTGTVSFTPPGGQPFTAASVWSSDSERARAFSKAGVSAGSAGIQPRTGGERYDHHLTIWALTNQPANPPTAGPPPTPTPTPEPVDDASAETGRGRRPS